jgi:hypothetical protein
MHTIFYTESCLCLICIISWHVWVVVCFILMLAFLTMIYIWTTFAMVLLMLRCPLSSWQIFIILFILSLVITNLCFWSTLATVGSNISHDLYSTVEMNENNTIYAFSYRIIVYVTKIQLFQSCHPSIKDLNSSKLLYKDVLTFMHSKVRW